MSVPATESPLKRIAADFAESRLALVGLVMLILVLIVAIGAPLVSPQNPYDLATLDIMDSKLPPGGHSLDGMTFWLGSDDQGRDMLSAIFYGLRISLGVGTLATVCALAIGLVVGLVAAWFGGWVEAAIMRLVDLQLSFPSILIALVLLASLGQGVDKIVIALVTVQWAYYARTVRGAALVERNKEYVQAARVTGVAPMRIMTRHVLPNVLGPVLVLATIQVATAIITEATLSFLGVGVPPTSPSLGTLIRVGNDYLFSGEWWITVFPALMLVIIALSVNLLGDWLRDALNPRLR